MTRLYTECRQSPATLGWEGLPVLGEDRHSFRARAWRRIGAALIGFWVIVGIALVVVAVNGGVAS